MTDIIESARHAIARHDAEAPSGVRYLSSALECVGLLRFIVESASAAPLADHGPTPCGPGNYYGYLNIAVIGGSPMWAVENYDGFDWQPCPRPVYDALLAADNKESTND